MSSARRILFALGLAAFVSSAVLIGCSGDDNDGDSAAGTGSPAAAPTSPAAAAPAPTQPSAAPAPAAMSVTIADFSYSPNAVTLRAGQPVSFNITNSGQFPHTFTIDGVADSQSMAAGLSRSLPATFAQPGTFTFYCTVHGRARMSGTITVSTTAQGPSGTTAPAPAAPASTPAGGSDSGY